MICIIRHGKTELNMANFMDFSVVDENGESRIVHIDNEADNAINVVADNLEDCLTKIYNHEEV